MGSQLQRIGARRVFPCFDEPAYKSRFDVTIVRRENMTSISNTELLESEDRYFQINYNTSDLIFRDIDDPHLQGRWVDCWRVCHNPVHVLLPSSFLPGRLWLSGNQHLHRNNCKFPNWNHSANNPFRCFLTRCFFIGCSPDYGWGMML